MRNYKVKAIINFNDLTDKTERVVGDEFTCTKERYDFLLKNNAVDLLEIIQETKAEVIEEHVEEKKEIKEEKPKKTVKKRITKKKKDN